MKGRKQEYTVNKAEIGKFPVFPEGTIFGAATAAYQIEGSAGEDGRGLSIWDIFSHRRGKTYNGDNGDTACEHYSRYRDDVAIMGRLGLDAYRFSISWPRILPEGRGAVNEKGLDFYDRLVDELLLAGIRPFATLFHWDFPYQLYRETGGFVSRRSARYFADYSEIVVKRLGDRVKDWITLNEPWIHSTLGYLMGSHAPGRHSLTAWARAIHHQMLAHARAMERIKFINPASRVGITLNISPVHPYGKSAADRNTVELAEQLMNGVMLDPLLKGEYPKQMMRRLNLFWPDIKSGDLEMISRPMNFLGINNYSRSRAMFAPWIPVIGTMFRENRIPNREYIKNGVKYTSMGWEVYPEGLYEILTNIRDNYGNIPVYITENGAAFNDRVDGYRINDHARTHFLYEYTKAAARAASDGCDLRGYFVWSLMDNFEWAEGYRKRFGIVHVDYENQRRTVKDSGYWYKDLILANRR